MAAESSFQEDVVLYCCPHPKCLQAQRGLGACDQAFKTFQTLSKHHKSKHGIPLNERRQDPEDARKLKIKCLGLYKRTVYKGNLETRSRLRQAQQSDPGFLELLNEVNIKQATDGLKARLSLVLTSLAERQHLQYKSLL